MHYRARPVLAASLVAALLIFAACQINPVTGKREISLVSPAEELALGDQATPGILAQLGGEYPDPALKAYVNEVGQKVVKEGRDYITSQHRDFPDWEFHFHVVNDSLINAFALPGGHVFITRGILDQMESESQLAGLLGHEASHVFLRHGAAHMTQQVAVSFSVALLSVALPDDFKWVAGVGMLASNLMLLKYSRDDESASDEWGMRFSVAANYEADGIIGLMRLLERSGGGAGVEFLSTHPSPANRVKRLTQLKEQHYARAVASDGYIEGKAKFGAATAAMRSAKSAYALHDEGESISSEAAAAFGKGDMAGGKRLYTQALTKFETAAAREPRHGLLHRKAGETKLVLGDFAGAVPSLEKARALDGADFYENYLYGVSLSRLGRHREALAALDASLAAAPENASALMVAGSSAEAVGEGKRAGGYYQRAYDLLPADNPEREKLRAKIVGLGLTDPGKKAGGGENSAAVLTIEWNDRAALYRALGGIVEHDHGGGEEQTPARR